MLPAPSVPPSYAISDVELLNHPTHPPPTLKRRLLPLATFCGLPWNLKRQRTLRQNYTLRNLLLSQPWRFPLTTFHLAVTTIQASIRLFLITRIARSVCLSINWRARYATSRRRPRRLSESSYEEKKDRDPANDPVTISFMEKFSYYCRHMKGEEPSPQLFEVFCATKIQSLFYRKGAVRSTNIRRYPFYSIAALLIQNSYRARIQRQYIHQSTAFDNDCYNNESLYTQYGTNVMPEDRMATRIQNAFRSYQGVRVYKFLRELIVFRNTGDPKMLLRTINPTEASLFDKATKIHLRFRLGGTVFPPTLYYKIFTRSPIADIGSFAPRDYTRPVVDPDEVHNVARLSQGEFPSTIQGTVKVGGSMFQTTATVNARERAAIHAADGDLGQEGWYERSENNGWRAVTVRATDELKRDSVETRPAVKSCNSYMFGLNGKTKEEKERGARNKKRQWLRQMYKNGLATEREPGKLVGMDRLATIHSSLLETGGGSTFVTHMDMAGVQQDGFDDDGEVEVEKLLEWTKELDYEGYMDDWRCIGTSGSSGAVVKKREEEKGEGADTGEFFNYGLDS